MLCSIGSWTRPMMLLGKDSQSHGGGEFNSVPFTTLPTHWFNGVLGGAARLSLYSISSSSLFWCHHHHIIMIISIVCVCSNFVYLHSSSSRTNGISRISRGLSLVSTVLSLLPRNATFLRFHFKHCENWNCCLLSQFIVREDLPPKNTCSFGLCQNYSPPHVFCLSVPGLNPPEINRFQYIG